MGKTFSRVTGLLLVTLLGCAARLSELPPPGRAVPQAFVVAERNEGPVTLIFPGRTAPCDDATLGIREMALRTSERAGGSVAVVTWRLMPLAREWVEKECGKRRARGGGEKARVCLVGHSWGAVAASKLAAELLSGDAVDEIPLLVTIDAIKKGYAVGFLNEFLCLVTLNDVFWRLPIHSFRAVPPPRGRLLRHVNYYQMSSMWLRGAPIATASEDHEVWFDTGEELGHGNLDNYLADIVAEDIRRSVLLAERDQLPQRPRDAEKRNDGRQ